MRDRVTHSLRRARRLPPTRAGDDGFGLIELIVSLSVFAILFGGLVVTMATGLGLARSNRQRTVAANLASQEIDSVRQATFGSLTIGLTTSTVSVDGVPFTVARNVEWVDNDSATGVCDSSTSTPQVLRVTVDVRWSDMKYVQPVHQSTVLSPPVGSYDATTGHIAVQVRDASAAPLGGVPVRVHGSGVDQTVTTTDSFAASPGCAFFGFLPPATYTVTLGTTGYVDRQGVTSPSQTVGVNAGQVASVAFDYDRAAALSLTLAGVNGGTPADAAAVTLGNTGFLPSGTKTYTGTGGTRSIAGLFPYVDGYAAWAGECADADPQGKDATGTAYWPGASREDPLEVQPNTTTTGTVTMATVSIDFTQAGAPDGTDTVVAVHEADSKCASGKTLTVATFSANTGNALVALPYGTWTLKVVGKTPVGAWPQVVLDPRSATTTNAVVQI